MIEVKRHSGGIEIKGHAGYAKPGKDIVCAAVTILIYTLLQSLGDLTDAEFEDNIPESIGANNTTNNDDLPFGDVVIKYGNLSEKAQALVDSFFVGVRLIADEYPKHVAILKK